MARHKWPGYKQLSFHESKFEELNMKYGKSSLVVLSAALIQMSAWAGPIPGSGPQGRLIAVSITRTSSVERVCNISTARTMVTEVEAGSLDKKILKNGATE